MFVRRVGAGRAGAGSMSRVPTLIHPPLATFGESTPAARRARRAPEPGTFLLTPKPEARSMAVHENLDQSVSAREDWSFRRRRGIPNNRRLWVLTCMDERIPVERALGLELGDAHIFRNAGGIVTDDAIRSAALTTNFFGTEEIIVLLHTECGMMSTTGEDVEAALRARLAERGLDLDEIELDPAVPGLRLNGQRFAEWVRTFTDVDEAAVRQEALLRGHPLIPDHVRIHTYIYEVESDRIRRPRARVADQTSTSPSSSADVAAS